MLDLPSPSTHNMRATQSSESRHIVKTVPPHRDQATVKVDRFTSLASLRHPRASPTNKLYQHPYRSFSWTLRSAVLLLNPWRWTNSHAVSSRSDPIVPRRAAQSVLCLARQQSIAKAFSPIDPLRGRARHVWSQTCALPQQVIHHCSTMCRICESIISEGGNPSGRVVN